MVRRLLLRYGVVAFRIHLFVRILHMIKRIILAIILNGLALYAVTRFVPEIVATGGFTLFALSGIILGLLNTFIKPLLKLLSLPFIFLSAGLFLVVINAALLFVLQEALIILEITGVSLAITGIGTYLWAGFLLGLVNWVENLFFKK